MSKYLVYDFRCNECEHAFDDFVRPDSYTTVCPECGAQARRLITGTRLDPKLGVDAEAFPTLAAKWARIRKQRAKIEAAHYKEHGTDRTPGADTAG